jgi:predicted DNA-binding WGR domain protein/ligand-binding sensor domain-containing protein
MTTRTFTFQEGSSSKFWEVTAAGTQLTIRFGRIGATGQTQLKSFSSPTACSATAEALIRSKVKKGYVEGSAPAKTAAGPAAAKKSPSRKAPRPDALLKAMQREDLAKLTSLLDAGGDVNTQSEYGSTLLHLAASSDRLEFVELLAARGANVEARDGEKRTPYMLTGSPAIRAALKKAGAKGLDSVNGRALEPKSRKARVADAEVDGGALGVDAKGQLWFASSDAVLRWDGKTLTRFEFEESFSVDRILPGLKGLLFFSTNWGIVTFEGKAWRLISPEDSELHDAHITDFAVDRTGVAYALGYGGEVALDRPISRYDGRSVTVLTAGAELPKGLETKNVAFDEKNRMVFLTNAGVRFADGKKWAPGDGDVARVVFDGNTTWADCGYFGLFRRVGTATKKFKFEDGVEALCLVGKTMWVGNSGGLHRIDGDSVQKLDGFFEDGVDGLALGRANRLWVSSGGKVFSVTGGVTRSLEGKVVEPTRADEE